MTNNKNKKIIAKAYFFYLLIKILIATNTYVYFLLPQKY